MVPFYGTPCTLSYTDFYTADLPLDTGPHAPVRPTLSFTGELFYIPAMSAPVEYIFSQSEMVMRPHRACMSDSLLEILVYLKDNAYVF